MTRANGSVRTGYARHFPERRSISHPSSNRDKPLSKGGGARDFVQLAVPVDASPLALVTIGAL